jgi:hypothetical protein
MGTFTTKDFASLLDEVLAAGDPPDPGSATRPSIPFDFFHSAEELSLAVPVDDPNAAAEYLFAAADKFSVVIETPPLAPELPSVAPFDIAQELRITGRERAEALDRIRRDFAFANHPDRVSADLRDRAMVRMQIANQMIDDAKRRLARIDAAQ